MGNGSVYAVHVGDGAKWADGSCPACREREDIAAALLAGLDVHGREVLLFAADGITARH